MEIPALVAAALVVIGPPALAAAMWVRRRHPGADAAEIAAVAYGGVGIAALALWLAAVLAGPSLGVAAIAPLLAAGLLALPAALRAQLATAGGRRAARDGSEPVEQLDGHVVPETVAGRGRFTAGPAAPPGTTAPAPARRGGVDRRHLAILAATGIAFAAAAWLPFLTYGMHRADGVHRMAMSDWYKHLAVTTALGAADVLPPPNPFLHSAAAAPYYYGFHLVAASVARLAEWIGGAFGADLAATSPAADPIYLALLLLTLLTAAATPFVAYTAARTIAAGRGSDLGDAPSVPLLAALGATLLAGFDLVPLAIDAVGNAVRAGPWRGGAEWLREVIPSTHLDYWIHHNERQLNAPYLTTIWAPQHMAAVLLALLVVHLLIRRSQAAEASSRRPPFGAPWLLPAALIAALPALSAYVALGLAGGVLGASVIESLSRRCFLWQTPTWRTWLLPGLAAAALAMPVLAVLASGPGPGLTLEVSSAGRWVNGALFSWWLGPGWFTHLIDSVALYAVELGVIGILACLEIRRRSANDRIQPHQAHVIALAVSIVVLVTFVRPPLGGPNNLYARPMVLVWFLLAPFAAMRFARATGRVIKTGGAPADGRPPVPRARGARRVANARWMMAGAALCLAANGYALLGVLLEGAWFWAAPPATVEASAWINANAPAGAPVAVHPDELTSAFGYWLRRPLLLADERHALLFGAGPEEYEDARVALAGAYAAASPEQAARRFDALGAVVVLIGAGGSGLSTEPPGPRPPAAIRDAQPLPRSWLRGPCFEVVHRNELWLVARRVAGAC
ncbi:MAG TPA: hypothetical protein VGC25_04180 [Alphaproteobacteria bacterium]